MTMFVVIEADSEFDDERRGFVIDELPLDGSELVQC